MYAVQHLQFGECHVCTEVPVQTIKKLTGVLEHLLRLNLMSVNSSSQWTIKQTFSEDRACAILTRTTFYRERL